jgi:hypothetical protein
MKLNKTFAFIISMILFLTLSCSEKNSESSANSKLQEGPTTVNKIDACTVITESELTSIINGEIKNPADKGLFLEENEYYHYISLCNFYHADNVITIRIAQKKKSYDPQKSRDSYYNIQKEDEDVTLIEPLEVSGTPANYFEMHEKDFDIKMNTLVLFTGIFEVSVISDFMNKDQLLKASEKILGKLK